MDSTHAYALAPLIRDLAVILGIAGLVALIFQKIRQPIVLGYLIAGVIIGPYTPPYELISDIPSVKTLSELGVIFLMFSLGLEFSFHKLKRVGFSASATGLVEVILMLIIGFFTGLTIGWSFHDSLFLGAALSISSTTIIIKALEELNLKRRRFAELVFGVLIVEDLLAILLLVTLSTVVLTQKFFSIPMLWSAGKLVLVVGSWFLLGYFLVPTLVRRVAYYISEELLTILSIALCLFLACLAASFHYSAALGAFIMGSILAETSLVHRIEQLIEPVRNIFAAVFFVSVGMLIDPKIIFDHFGLVIFLTVITIMGKIITTSLGAFLTGQSVNTSLRAGFSMAQIGEFSFIIVGLGFSLGVINSSLYPIIVAVSAITTFATPYLIRYSATLEAAIEAKMPPPLKSFLDSYTAWIYHSQASAKDQISYHKTWSRLILNGLIVAIIFTLTQNFILPKIKEIAVPLFVTTSLAWLCALILSSPFIWAMLTSVQNVKFVRKKNPSRTLIYFFSFFVPLAEVSILSVAYFRNWFVSLFLIGVAIIFFVLLYKKLEQSYQWFENHLVNNLRVQSINQLRYEELAPWDRHLVEIRVNEHSPYIGCSLQQLQLREKYGINIVAIWRNGQVIFAPSNRQEIHAHDKLIVLGKDEQIEIFRRRAERVAEPENEDEDFLASFALQTIVLEKKHPAIDKTIREWKNEEKIGGLIVGLERHAERILNPKSDTILQEGDLLIIVGER